MSPRHDSCACCELLCLAHRIPLSLAENFVSPLQSLVTRLRALLKWIQEIQGLPSNTCHLSPCPSPEAERRIGRLSKQVAVASAEVDAPFELSVARLSVEDVWGVGRCRREEC
ncbi:hypothetical protein B0T11DRAFT_318471 [Plectosphaerella cucumerina]|uniref:Uncharacterized protein n=1 Tax=Plectosphaerella cucumerina TaxID=40658 RepID=A0A8K0TFY9_9PEZI|nr:hypothetical protein B0T11DRAFT_318471 [Plectosphaerella cucumerina]